MEIGQILPIVSEDFSDSCLRDWREAAQLLQSFQSVIEILAELFMRLNGKSDQ